MRIDPLYWSPARMNFAAFKLLAWALLRKRPRILSRRDVDRVVIKLTPGRNGFEAFSLAVAHTVLSLFFIYALFERYVRARPAAFVLLSPLFLLAALIVTQTAIFLICLGVSRIRRAMRRPDSMKLNALAVTTATVAIAAWLIDRGGWSLWPGGIWLGLLALNILAAGVVYLMRGSLREMELEIERGATFAA